MIELIYDRKERRIYVSYNSERYCPENFISFIKSNGIRKEIIGYVAPQDVDGAVEVFKELKGKIEEAFLERDMLGRLDF